MTGQNVNIQSFLDFAGIATHIYKGFIMDTQINNTEKLSRREREKALHRQQIMDAAIKVFAEKGFHAATLEEIAQEAEFSKGALYLYFSNKEDLIYSILYNAFNGWSGFFNKILTGKRKFREEITEMFTGIAEEVFKKPDLYHLISAQHATFFNSISEEKRSEFIDKHNQFWNDFETRIKKAIENRELRELPVEGIAGLIHGSLDAMVQNHWNCETLEELKRGIKIFMEILFNGIGEKKEAEGAQ